MNAKCVAGSNELNEDMHNVTVLNRIIGRAAVRGQKVEARKQTRKC